MARTVADRLICAARAGWYDWYEKRQLAWVRAHSGDWHWEETDIDESIISVLIPTYNRADLLINRCLKSVRAQTYQRPNNYGVEHNLEIIVADHSSTDDTAGRVAALNDARIRLLRVPRRRRYPATAENHWLAGPVDPINAALEAARGAWIARIDDDDEWTPDHVEKLLRFAQQGNYEFVSSAYHRDTGLVREKVAGGDTAGAAIGGVQTWLYRSYLKFMHANIDCWRKDWNRANDLDLAERFVKAGVRTGWLQDSTAVIRPRPGERYIGSRAYLNSPKKTEAFYKFT